MSRALFPGWRPDADGRERLAALAARLRDAHPGGAPRLQPRRPDQWHAPLCFIGYELRHLATPALHALDSDAAGFEWLVGDDREQSVYAWARHDGAGDVALVACNFTPVPREGYRLPLPKGAPKAWREALNTGGKPTDEQNEQVLKVARDVARSYEPTKESK